jgi:uncharacterized membrane protein
MGITLFMNALLLVMVATLAVFCFRWLRRIDKEWQDASERVERAGEMTEPDTVD